MSTIKQRKALENLAENGGNIGKAMKDAGYSEVSSKTPKKLTESKGFAELRDEYLPSDLALKAHKEAFDATKPFSSHTEPDKEVPDNAIRLKAAELYYKMTGQLIDKAQIDGKLEVILTRE